jgi:hypothetical protein
MGIIVVRPSKALYRIIVITPIFSNVCKIGKNSISL